jgi:hypothetical protein
VKKREVTEHSARLPGEKTIRSKVALSIQGKSDPGETARPCSSREMRPASVG